MPPRSGFRCRTLHGQNRFIQGELNMSADIQERICKIIAEQLSQDAEEVVPEASFIDDLGADSLDLVELVMHMEEEFDVEIPDENDPVSLPDTTPAQTPADAEAKKSGDVADGKTTTSGEEPAGAAASEQQFGAEITGE